MAAEGTEK